jgi:hypothetical protein
MSGYKDPFYQDFYNIGAASTYVQPNLASAPQVYLLSQLNEQSLEAIRQIVREEVQRILAVTVPETVGLSPEV